MNFFLNGKQLCMNQNESFKDLIDNAELKGKAQDKTWIVNGVTITPQNNTKIGTFIQNGANVLCNDGGQFNQQPKIGFAQNIFPQPQAQNQFPKPPFPAQQQQFTFQQPQFPNQNQLPAGWIQPQQNQQAFINQIPQFQQNQPIKQKQFIDTKGTQNIEKVINNFKVIIKNEAKTVYIEKISGEFKAEFDESNTNDKQQISINEHEVILDQSQSLNLDISKSTKVLFLREYTGICIKWFTGLITKFEFFINE